MPLTRSANPVLESIPPPKPRRRPTKRKARARPEHVPSDEAPEVTDQSYTEAVTHSRDKHVEAQVPRRKHPTVVTPTAPTTTTMRRKHRGLSTESIGRASATSVGRGGRSTRMKKVAATGEKRSSIATGETQEVITIAKRTRRQNKQSPESPDGEAESEAEPSEEEVLQGSANKRKAQITQKGKEKVVPGRKNVLNGSSKSPRLSGTASTPRARASSRGESSRKRSVEKHEMDNVLSAAITTPSKRQPQGSVGQEGVSEPGYYGALDRRLSEWDKAKHLAITDQMRKSRKSHLDYDSEPEVSAAEKSREATPDNGDPSSEEIDDDELTLLLYRIEEYSTKLISIRERMVNLMSDFKGLKDLQHPPIKDGVGYVELLHKLTYTIINNRSHHLSEDEVYTLQYLDEAMIKLSHFYKETKVFENIFRRLQKSNLTQRSNINKCQAGIKKTMRVRGYMGASSLVTEVDNEMLLREKNKKAVRKRNREIEAVVKERERISLGYQTPESVEDRSQKREREEEEDEEEDEEEIERLQKRIRPGQDEEGEEGEDEVEDYGYNEWYGGEEQPIIIDEEDVEVVHVEGFGERQKKARAREERMERGEGEVEVLEDHEWEEQEIGALLHGIEKFQDNFRFEKIKNLYGFGNLAPLKNRSIEAIRDKAIELKKELIDSGEEELLGHFWDGI